MFRVGYEKIASRHFRQHLVEPASGRSLCGFSDEKLARLSSLLDPSGFLAFGSDAEVCRKCAVRASSVSARHVDVLPRGEGDHWSEILGRMAADGNHLLEDA